MELCKLICDLGTTSQLLELKNGMGITPVWIAAGYGHLGMYVTYCMYVCLYVLYCIVLYLLYVCMYVYICNQILF